jgi:glycosyltransferase involved in cell wall biosynthesis
VILVDDCSTDGSRELCLQMARSEPRITAFPLPENRGQGFARNIGVTLAQVPYVTFLDQDDEHAPGWYDHALEVLSRHPHVAGVRGEIELRDVPPDLSVGPGDPRWSALVHSPLWNVVMRKVAYQAVGGCPTSRAYRTREGAEDVTLVVALREHFTVAKTGYVATRHYLKPSGATAYVLRRTRVVGDRIEFLELTETERSGDFDKTNLAYQEYAASNVSDLRQLLRPRFRGVRNLIARASAAAIRRISRA